MELKDKLEMIMKDETIMEEAERVYKQVGSYERTIELIWNKYFKTF